MLAPDRDMGSGVYEDDLYGNANEGEQNRKKAKWKDKEGIAKGPPRTAGEFKFSAKVRSWTQTEDPYTYSAEAVHVADDGRWMRRTGSSDETAYKAVKQAMADLGFSLWMDEGWKTGPSPLEEN